MTHTTTMAAADRVQGDVHANGQCAPGFAPDRLDLGGLDIQCGQRPGKDRPGCGRSPLAPGDCLP